jgi:hypothetical protein
MAGRIPNRRELRKHADQAEQSEAVASDATPAAVPPEKKAKKAPASKRKPRAPKAPPRLRARWGVFDGGMKQVAIFNYDQRAAADAKLADLLAKKRASTSCKSSRNRCPSRRRPRHPLASESGETPVARPLRRYHTLRRVCWG